MTCVSAMLLGLKYEEVELAFGGNLDPSKVNDESSRKKESARLWRGVFELLETHHRGMVEFSEMTAIAEGRRYWVEVQIHDPSNPLSETVGHSIAIDEFGKGLRSESRIWGVQVSERMEGRGEPSVRIATREGNI
jgi:hypothetical protein